MEENDRICYRRPGSAHRRRRQVLCRHQSALLSALLYFSRSRCLIAHLHTAGHHNFIFLQWRSSRADERRDFRARNANWATDSNVHRSFCDLEACDNVKEMLQQRHKAARLIDRRRAQLSHQETREDQAQVQNGHAGHGEGERRSASKRHCKRMSSAQLRTQ